MLEHEINHHDTGQKRGYATSVAAGLYCQNQFWFV